VKLFTKDPLDAARDSLVKLTERLATAGSVVIEKKESTKRLAVDGADDAALDKAEAAVRAASDRVGTLTVAILEVGNTISVLEAEQAAAADQKVRAATVVELEAIERNLTKAADDTVSSAKRLSEVATRMGTFMPDAVGLSIFAASAASEIPPNVVLLKSLLKGYISGVVSGGGRATLPQPAPAPSPTPPKPELVQLCTMKNVCWHDGNTIRTAHAGHKIFLLPAVAANAIKLGACVEPQDPRAKFHSDQRKVTTPLLENCVPLDSQAASAVSAATAEPRGVVQPIRRSPPPRVVDASRPLQQAAMRSVDDHGNTFELTPGKPYTVSIPRENPQPGGKDDE
jgi:hypothetical protein